MRGAANILQYYENTLKVLIANGAVVAGYRPRGTLRQVLLWYIDAINLGIEKYNADADELAPGEPKLPLFSL